MKITKGLLILMRGVKVGRLYVLQGSMVTGSATVTNSTITKQETKLWHMRLDHMSEKGMNVLSKKGFCEKKLGTFSFCEDCVFWKHKRVSFKPIVHNTKGVLDCI